jgi:DNA-directed RNA polymerase alpha subunit/DNA-directed RNA polymerase subunit L
MSIVVEDNKDATITNDFYINNVIAFTINNISVPLANSIRRTILSDIPSVSFDDTWIDNENTISIHIVKNNSGLHNEFLSHRLSLIPINRYNVETRNRLQIETIFNTTTNKRDFSFNSETDIPTFKLHIHNSSEASIKKNNYGLVEVNSNHIQYGDFMGDIDVSSYFQPDLYIKDTENDDEYIILNMLKDNEELEIYMKPTIGLGKYNARYCTVGTVSYKFNIDEEKVETTFNQIIQKANEERIEKKLNVFNKEEIEAKKKSFMLLDKERVYKSDIYKKPNSFHYCVESIGALPSHQIVYDSLIMIRLRLNDIVQAFTGFIKNDTTTIYANKDSVTHNKVNVYQSIDNLLGYTIVIQNNNHTMGNLINHYINMLFTNSYMDIEDVTAIPNFESIDLNEVDLYTYNQSILEHCGYKMPHPLHAEIEFKLKLSSKLGEFKIFELYEEYSLELNQMYNIQIGDVGLISDQETQKIIVIYTFIKTIKSIQQIVTNLLHQWTSETNRLGQEINESSFIVNDNSDVLTTEYQETLEEKEEEDEDEDDTKK